MTTHKNFSIGKSDFKNIVEGNYIFIDKTLFIKDIMENGAEVILITRPRRFGKTMNMSMLQRFLELDGDASLFNNLKVEKHPEFCQKHQNKYPIIFVSFKDIKDNNFDHMYSDIKHLFSTLYKEHAYLLDGDTLSEGEKALFKNIQNKIIDDPSDLSFALFNLIYYVKKKYGTAPVLLIDEYDTPIHSAYTNNCYEDMVNLMRKILGSSLKDNPHLGKAVMTGIILISQESLFSGLNNVRVYSVLDERYSSYFGFSEEEVIFLLPQDMKIEPIRAWYNGYTIGKDQLYNPWSIINYLDNHGKLKPYWINTSDNALVFKIIEKTELEEPFQKLIEGNSLIRPLTETLTFSYLEGSEEAAWTLLLHAGYLTVTSLELDSIGQHIGNVIIPNQEVMSIYVQMVRFWFSEGKKTSDYFSLLESLELGDIQTFARHLRDYICTSGSYFDFSKKTAEQVFHVFMLGLLVGLRDKYEIHSNKEAGLGRCDMAFIPHDKTQKGIILKFKACKNPKNLENTAKEALTQIDEKRYDAHFKTQNTLKIGLAFCGKEVISAHCDENNNIVICKPEGISEWN